MLKGLKNINKKQILKLSASIVMLVLIGASVEYFGFGHKLKSLPEAERGIAIVKNSDIVADGFVLNEKNEFVVQKENASLVLSQTGYINNLEIDLAGNYNYDVIVKYLDPQTGQEIVLQKNTQSIMDKNKLNFLNFLVFNIDSNPEKITIQALNPQVSIAQIKIDNSYYFNPYRFLFICVVDALLLILFLLRKRIGQNPEYGFLAVALLCGTLIAMSETRSYVSWDERIHYKGADKISLKNIIKKDTVDIYSRANSIPCSYSIKEQQNIDEYFDHDYAKGVAKNKTGKFSLTEAYNEIGYWPSALALMLGRLIDLPSHIIFVFGRWINVIFFSLIVFWAIRKLKTGKMIMAIIALFPTSIFLASNYGYDSWVTAFSMLGLAYVFSELQQPEKKITAREMAIMIGAFVIGFGPKAIYFPLMFLLFLLRPAKFDSPKQYKKFMLAVSVAIVFVVGSFMLPFMIAGPGNGDGRGGDAVDSTEQVRFILSDPIVYSKILFNFIKGYINPLNAADMIAFFAYLGGMKGFGIISTLLLVAVFTDKNEYDEKTANLKTRLLVVGIFLATVALIATALYVAFTAVRSPIIVGVQPRYLIPLIFPLLFVAGSSRLKNAINKNIYNMIIFGISASVLLQGIWVLITNLYY